MSIEHDIDLMDGLFAFDMGCASSGISDPLAKERFKKDAEYSFKIATLLLKYYLSKDGYTIEDAKQLIDWVERELEFDI